MIPGKKNYWKNDPRKIVSRKNVLQKLFSVKRMLGNLNAFYISIDWFHYTHKKTFDAHLTILHARNCRTLKESSVFISANTLTEDPIYPDIRTQIFSDPYYPDIRIICISELSEYLKLKHRIRWIRIIRISGYSHYPNPNFSTRFHRLITSENSTYTHTHTHTHTPWCSTLTPRFFISEFSGTIIPWTNFPGTIFPGNHFSEGPFSRDFSLGDFFPGDHFSGDLFFAYRSSY